MCFQLDFTLLKDEVRMGWVCAEERAGEKLRKGAFGLFIIFRITWSPHPLAAD